MQPVKNCSMPIATKFIFEYILSQFGCPKILMSDRDSHFFNETIATLLEDFQIYHRKTTHIILKQIVQWNILIKSHRML